MGRADARAHPTVTRGIFATTLLLAAMPAPAAPPVLDFADHRAMQGFRVVNDGVMGGVSTSRLSHEGDALRFEGEVSLENNGGFASFRGPVRMLAGATALIVTVRGDGQRYKLTLKLDDSGSTPQYQASFVAPPEWTTVRFVAGDFRASFRGRAVAAPPLVLGEVRALGVLISDRQAGPFRLELRVVRAE